jgi:D-alanine-D-alanine ligase
VEIGIAYDVRPDSGNGDGPDDRLEEYDSPATVDAVARALRACGYEARRLGGGRDLILTLLERPPELVFNMAEGAGTRSREAHVPAVCEMLGVPYTHSDPLTLSASLDKAVAKTIVSAAGVPTPRWHVVAQEDEEVPLDFPVLAKPLAEGSSMGIRSASRAEDRDELRVQVTRLLRDYAQPVLVEEFCPGPELTVGILGTGSAAVPLGVMEIVPRDGRAERFVYSTEVKRLNEAAVEYRVPPRRPAELLEQVVAAALGAFRALGCRDVARVDVRVGGDGKPCFLEINPLPGLRPAWGDIAILSERVGTSFEGLIGRIVASARERQGI